MASNAATSTRNAGAASRRSRSRAAAGSACTSQSIRAPDEPGISSLEPRISSQSRISNLESRRVDSFPRKESHMASYYLSEDLARFGDIAKTNPKLFDLFLKWY